MKEITKIEEKEQLSSKIKELVSLLNSKLKEANDLRLMVNITQGQRMSRDNSLLSVNIYQNIIF